MNVHRENRRSVKTLEVDPKITPRPKRGYWLRTPGGETHWTMSIGRIAYNRRVSAFFASLRHLLILSN